MEGEQGEARVEVAKAAETAAAKVVELVAG